MTCAICEKHIAKGEATDEHHPLYRSLGGTQTVTAHKRCHILLHSKRGDFKQWGKLGGKQSAMTKRWSFNLLNVRDHPAYESARQSYLMNYAYAGWGEGI
jgi:hypothetical protein